MEGTKKSPSTKTLIAVRLTPYEQQRIRELAAAHGVAFSVALRTTIEVGLSKILDVRGYENPR